MMPTEREQNHGEEGTEKWHWSGQMEGSQRVCASVAKFVQKLEGSQLWSEIYFLGGSQRVCQRSEVFTKSGADPTAAHPAISNRRPEAEARQKEK